MPDEENDAEVPPVVTYACPVCGDETTHDVLKGTVSTRGGYTLDVTGKCRACSNVQRIVVKEPGARDVRVILSHGAESRRTTVGLPGDEPVAVDMEMIVDGVNTLVTGIENTEGLRVERAAPADIGTLWVKAFEIIPVKWSINLNRKTITKVMEVEPEHVFEVGEEHTFDRLRVTIHSIKAKGALLRKGHAEAADIVRVFAKPTPPERRTYRPEKPERERARRREERRERREG